jgi:hypothetical protein
MSIRKAKESSQLFMSTHTNGMAIKFATITSFKKSFDNKRKIFGTDDPRTFLMPISFVRCDAVKDARPKRPKDATNIASIAKNPKT